MILQQFNPECRPFPVEMRLKVKNGSIIVVLLMIATVQISILKDCSRFFRKSIFKKNSYSIGYFQSGLSTEELYSKVAQLVVSNKISRVIGIGETISQFKDEFVNCITFQTTVDFVAYFDTLDFSNETILIKERLFQFEEIVHLLEEKTHETVLEINLNAISYNLNFFV
jgi:alanine racemase